ncbi:MAG: FAD-dependent oxidoreductase [candidate division Zixibacteria bacterium]|nr:FAD-dependent oxidoreductase [candidate division Zixibacteria bacterium]
MSKHKIPVSVNPLEWYRDNVPCRTACPVDTDSGQYVQLIAQEKFGEAFNVARSPNPLASICGRVCAAPCEDACRRAAIDSPVSIRALKRFVTEQFGSESQKPNSFKNLLGESKTAGSQSPGHLSAFPKNQAKTGKKVAIIGSGPAGLGAAHDLALMGHEVVIFEALDEPGGMMRFGIPEYRLPRSVIAKEVSNILDLGVSLKTKSPISREFGISKLRADGYDAIFLAVGTQAGSALNIPGVELDGVIKAVDYLININKGFKVNLGEKVLVIGGGSVALDAARTAIRGFYSPQDAIETAAQAGDLHIAIDAARSAKREGAKSIHVASLESFEEMPAATTMQGAEELDEAKAEGIIFHPSKGPKAIIGEDGLVKGVELIDVASVFDKNGRFNPKYVDGTEEIIKFDNVILAIGQKAETGFLVPEDNIEITPRGTIKADPKTLETSAPGVFSGGDVVFGPRILIEAVENGKRAAHSIHKYLTSSDLNIRTKVTIEKMPISDYSMPVDYEKVKRSRPETISVDKRSGISEVEGLFQENEAVKQAERCLKCHIETVYDPNLCVLCNRCVDICPEECLELVDYNRVDLNDYDTSKIDASIATGGNLSVMLKDHTACIRCALCAKRCPTGAWTMEHLSFQDIIEGEN